MRTFCASVCPQELPHWTGCLYRQASWPLLHVEIAIIKYHPVLLPLPLSPVLWGKSLRSQPSHSSSCTISMQSWGKTAPGEHPPLLSAELLLRGVTCGCTNNAGGSSEERAAQERRWRWRILLQLRQRRWSWDCCPVGMSNSAAFCQPPAHSKEVINNTNGKSQDR